MQWLEEFPLEMRLKPPFQITLTNLQFSNWKAKYGGADYIHSVSVESKADIINCIFQNDQEITSSSSQASFVGGSAMSLTSKSSWITDCMFLKEIGESQLKIENDFGQSDEEALLLQSQMKTFNVVRFYTI